MAYTTLNRRSNGHIHHKHDMQGIPMRHNKRLTALPQVPLEHDESNNLKLVIAFHVEVCSQPILWLSLCVLCMCHCTMQEMTTDLKEAQQEEADRAANFEDQHE